MLEFSLTLRGFGIYVTRCSAFFLFVIFLIIIEMWRVLFLKYHQKTLENVEGLYADIIKWKHFPHHWHFVRIIHRWPVDSPRKGQWRGALMCPLICAWINGWANNRWFETPLRSLWRHRKGLCVTCMRQLIIWTSLLVHVSVTQCER